MASQLAKYDFSSLNRFLATGDSYKTIALSYRVGIATVSKIVVETCEAIWNALQPVYVPHPDMKHWEDIADGFGKKWQFHNCLGAIDGKHVLIFAPQNSGTMYYNYKKTFSVVLLALVDSSYCFTVIDIGSYGSNSDGGIFKTSTLGKRLMNKTLDVPDDKGHPVVEQNSSVPYVMVGDEAFPSLENLLIPLRPENVDTVVKATCVLHNMLQNQGIPVPTRPKHADDRSTSATTYVMEF
jgi:hypothetical protein